MSLKRQVIILAVTVLTTWMRSKVFLLLIILQVVEMIVTSNKGWRDKSDFEIFDNLRDWVMKCDVKYVKRDALDKIDYARSLWCRAEYVSAVHLLDENEVFLKKSDWPYYALGIEILKARKHEFFDE